MFKWYARNSLLAIIVGTVPLSNLFLMMTLFFDTSLSYYITITLDLIVLNSLLVLLSRVKLFTKGVKSLDNKCDPYPMLEETTAQLSRSKLKKYKLILAINKAVALRALGDIEAAYEILRSVDSEQFTGYLHIIKIIYFNNVADLYVLKNDVEQAKIFYEKECQLISKLKNKKQKAYMTEMSMTTLEDIYILSGEYDKAEEILLSDFKNLKSKRIKVNMNLALGKIYFFKGDNQKAISAFQFVINNGNKLFDVVQAKEFLSKLQVA